MTSDEEILHKLIGRTIVKTAYFPDAEGSYILGLDDGSEVGFSSSGDDMTFTSMFYTEVPENGKENNA